jgi:hypothetical protein
VLLGCLVGSKLPHSILDEDEGDLTVRGFCDFGLEFWKNKSLKTFVVQANLFNYTRTLEKSGSSRSSVFFIVYQTSAFVNTLNNIMGLFFTRGRGGWFCCCATEVILFVDFDFTSGGLFCGRKIDATEVILFVDFDLLGYFYNLCFV